MIKRYARFVMFLVVASVVIAITWAPDYELQAILTGFDAGAAAFLISLVSLFSGATATSMRQRSQANEPDHHLLLFVFLAIVAVTIVGVWAEFIAISTDHKGDTTATLLLATTSLALVWLFANAIATIHYAHLWYLRAPAGKTGIETDHGDMGGLAFPGARQQPDKAPDYWDFAYFSVVLSMTFQVSDVQITRKSLRRVALVHSLAAFLFNISVIALSVSLVSTILGK